MKRILIALAIACAVILPGFALTGGPTALRSLGPQSAAADSCWLTSTSLGTSGNYIIGQGVIECGTVLYRTLRVYIIQDGVSRASGTTTGTNKVLWSSPSCQIQYAGPYPSYIRVQLTSSSGFVWNWYGPTKYLPRC